MKKNFLLVLICSKALSIISQTIAPDNSFNAIGHNSINLTSGAHFGQKIHQQQDGKLILSATAGSGSLNYDFYAIRFNTNGTIDNAYANNGYKQISFGSAYDELLGSAQQKDGKIILCGASSNNGIGMAIARLDTNGTLDNTFGASGKYFDILQGESYAYCTAIQNNGQIVLAGSTKIGGFTGFRKEALIRLNANGTLDNTFGNNGVVINDIDTSKTDEARSLAIDSNQNILIGSGGNSGKAILTKIKPNGLLDSTFGNGGNLQLITSSAFNGIYELVIQSDGKYIFVLAESNEYLIRLNPNGTFDSTFNGNGKVLLDTATNSRIAVQPNGKIIVVSTKYTFSPFAANRELRRLNADGSLDISFGINGKYLDIPKVLESTNGILLQQDSKIVLSGDKYVGQNGEAGLSRYTNTFTSNLAKTKNDNHIIYPNPSKDAIWIKSEYNQLANIYDIYGNMFKTIELQKPLTKLNLDFLSSGSYLIKIGGDNIKFIKD
jgi:uncharacterized delta-60 repeat protein